MKRCLLLGVAVGLLAVGCAPSKEELDKRLLDAVHKGNVTAARKALKEGADPNAVDPKQGFTALVLSLQSPDMIEALIKAGADPNREDPEFGLTPMDYVAQTGSLDSLKRLAEGGAKINPPTSWLTPLQAAVGARRMDMVEYLVSHKADVNARDNNGSTALHHLVVGGLLAPKNAAAPTAVCKYLLAHGADPSIADKKGRTPYELAKERFFKKMTHSGEIVDLLKPRSSAGTH
jgi:ankyrin repeat protein